MNNDDDLKMFPVHETDKAAEDFVDNADLSAYDFSEFKAMSFEFAPKDKSVTLRLSEPLLDAVKNTATKQGMPYQRFIRHVLEGAVQR